MKPILTTAILILISLFSNAQKGSFNGKIEGIDSAVIRVTILPLKLGETPISKIIHCENGKFDCEIDYNLNMWHSVWLQSRQFSRVIAHGKVPFAGFKNEAILFFIYPGDKLTIQGKKGNYGMDYQVFGNEISNQRNRFSEDIFPLEKEFNRLFVLWEELWEDSVKKVEIEDQMNGLKNQIKEVKLKLIATHPDWIYSAEVLAEFPEDTIARYFKTFTPDVQNSFFGIHLSKILNAAAVGSVAPDFTLKDEKGRNVSLNDFAGKYVVLDFWGSWCGYCIQGIPKMKSYQEKYRGKIDFVSIAYKDSRPTWLKAISKYELNWTNLIAENDEVRDKFGVEGFPTKIIIDPDGKIVLKTTGESDEFYLKMDELFSK